MAWNLLRVPVMRLFYYILLTGLYSLHAKAAHAQDIMPRVVHDGLMAASVSCGDTTHCPPSVGMLVGAWERFHDESDGSSASDYQVLTCTGTLITNTIFMTNRHCLPPEVQAKEVSPRHRLAVAFPASGGFPAQVIPVGRILLTSDETALPSEHVPDYALLRLSRSAARSTTAVSRSGPVMNQRYRIASIDRGDSNGFAKHGELNVREVQAKEGIPLLPSRFERWPALFGLGQGRLRMGHSGSAILDSNDAMIGLFYAVYTPSAGGPRTDGSYSEGYAFNAACLPITRNMPGPRPAYCEHDWYDAWEFRGAVGP